MLNEQQAIDFLNNSKLILSKIHKATPSTMKKFERMQEVYLSRNVGVYAEERIKEIRRWFQTIRFKDLLVDFHSEELWALSMACRWKLPELIDNSMNTLVWDESEKFIGLKCLEAFLFQARSLLNIYMFYICLIMNVNEPPVNMSFDDFTRQMNRVDSGFKNRAQKLKCYFEENVFANGSWGALVRGLRDKIAHRDMLRPSQEGEEIVLGIHLDWPTIRRMTFERLTSHFKNGIFFDMYVDTSPLLFELEWKYGPYKPDLWD